VVTEIVEDENEDDEEDEEDKVPSRPTVVMVQVEARPVTQSRAPIESRLSGVPKTPSPMVELEEDVAQSLAETYTYGGSGWGGRGGRGWSPRGRGIGGRGGKTHERFASFSPPAGPVGSSVEKKQAAAEVGALKGMLELQEKRSALLKQQMDQQKKLFAR
jgi:hypothetical protein